MICKSKKIDENEVYNKAKKLLEIYRDVCWETSEYADQVRENLMVDYGYMSGDLDTALVQYTEAEMMEELCLERSSYYRRKKEAVMVFGLTIWGGALDDFRQIMIVNEPTQMSIYDVYHRPQYL